MPGVPWAMFYNLADDLDLGFLASAPCLAELEPGSLVSLDFLAPGTMGFTNH